MTLKFTQLAVCAAIGAAASLFTTDEAQAGCNPAYAFIGDICITAATYCPEGTAMAHGQELSISGNQELYAVLGTTYGGDGRTTFNLPDLQGRVPVGAGKMNQPAALTGGYAALPVGKFRGSEYAHRNNDSLIPHTHEAYIGLDGGVGTAARPETAPVAADTEQGTQQSTDKIPVTVESTGKGTSIFSVDPQLTINYCVITTGNFPPRPE